MACDDPSCGETSCDCSHAFCECRPVNDCSISTHSDLINELRRSNEALKAEVHDYRNVLEQIATMPHHCIFCHWDVGGLPKGLHNTGCLFANTLDKYLDNHLRRKG
jgi:hypothetical protein